MSKNIGGKGKNGVLKKPEYIWKKSKNVESVNNYDKVEKYCKIEKIEKFEYVAKC